MLYTVYILQSEGDFFVNDFKENTIKEIVANNLRYFRELKDLTQRELAEKMGVKYNTISSWENGPNSINISDLMKFCDLLDISIDEMFKQEKKTALSIRLSERESYALSLFKNLSEDDQLKFIGRLEMMTESNEISSK